MSLRLDTTGYSLLFSRGFRGAPKRKAGSDSLNAGREKNILYSERPPRWAIHRALLFPGKIGANFHLTTKSTKG